MSVLDGLLKRLDSLNEAIVIIQEDNKRLQKLNDVLIAEKKQWILQRPMQEQIIAQQLQSSGLQTQKLQDEICVLRKKHNDY